MTLVDSSNITLQNFSNHRIRIEVIFLPNCGWEDIELTFYSHNSNEQKQKYKTIVNKKKKHGFSIKN